jgi:hypothetical protein
VPQIKTFDFPLGAYATGILILLASYLTLAQTHGDSPYFNLAHRLNRITGGSLALKIFWTTYCGMHGLEGLYALSLCRKHRTGFTVGVSSRFILSLIFRADEYTPPGVVRGQRVDIRISCVEKFAQQDSECTHRVCDKSGIKR